MITSDSRYVSQLTRDSLALVLAGGKGSRLHELTRSESKPALHFGGKFRVIDFPLSNCINSGIRQIGVVTQYKAYSLLRHLVQGWGHLNRELGEFVELLPASQQKDSNWYRGTADALYQNIDFIRENAPKYVVVLSGDHVYKMDYGDMLVKHVESGADMSVSCIEVPIQEAANSFGVVKVNSHNRILEFEEKPTNPAELEDKSGYTLASMGNYIFNTDFLIEQLCKDAQILTSQHDFGHDLIPNLIKSSHVTAYRFRNKHNQQPPYWRDVGTLDAFWQANMDLLDSNPKLSIYDDDWPIWTYQKQAPPAKFLYNDSTRKGYAVESMVSGGWVVAGAKIDGSLLFSDVKIASYSEIYQSVLLPKVEVGERVKICKAIIESGTKIPDGLQIGVDSKADLANGFRLTKQGVVLVTSAMIGALNCRRSKARLAFPNQFDSTTSASIDQSSLAHMRA